MLFVKIPEENQMVKIDSAEVVHGLFAMKGAVDSIMLAALYMDDITLILSSISLNTTLNLFLMPQSY